MSSRIYKNFLSTYLDYTKKSESPLCFHRWSCLSIVASALGRRCWVHRGYYTLFPNMYVVLVSESAICRKTTAAEIAIKMLRRTGKVDILNEKLTNAYLMQHLSNSSQKSENGDASVTVFAPELSTFLGKDAYISGLVSTITSAYTCPDELENRTKNKGIDMIRNVSINILGATTMEWMSQNLPGDSVEGGFTGRVIFVVSDEPQCRNAWPKLTAEEMQIRENLTLDLMQINQMQGEFKFTLEAERLFEVWYNTAQEPEDLRLRPYFGRKGDHVLKVALLLSICEGDSMLVNHIHIQQALNYLDELEKMMPQAFRGVAFSKTSKDADRILRQIEKFGGSVQHSILLKKNYCYLNAREFEEVIRTLVESAFIFEFIDGKKKMYKLVKEGVV